MNPPADAQPYLARLSPRAAPALVLLVALIGGLALARRDEPTADGPEQEPAAPADNRKEVRP